jgi:DNA-binding MarR family transcriptional regulator
MDTDPVSTTEPIWLDVDEARAWRGYVLMSRLLTAQLGRGLSRDAGMSNADYEVLVHLSEEPGHRLRMHELASRMLWEKSRLSHQVSRMEQRGLVERAECPTDGRGSFVVLSDAGLKAIESAAPAHVAEVRRHFLDLLSGEQQRALIAITERVIEHLTGPGRQPAVEGDGHCE